MRLNRYISLSGYCSRRKADELILANQVEVNKKKITSLGHHVDLQDEVVVENHRISLPQKFVYMIMNKPVDVITTRKDPQGRLTVIDLISQSKLKKHATVLPVGRLDRNTSGVLLLTNDGDLLHFLTHPSNQIPKLYQVSLKENLNLTTLNKLRKGLHLEDGFIKPDAIDYHTGSRASKNYSPKRFNKKTIMIKLHSGKNRIIRRMFREVGQHIVKLHRVSFAGLNAKGIGVGGFRELNAKEIAELKSLQNSEAPRSQNFSKKKSTSKNSKSAPRSF